MRAVKSKNTTLELRVRKLAHSLGYRFRLHRKNLAGTPDLVFASRRKVIFVHGCFWHGHDCARGARVPKENAQYWRNKILRNRERDRSAVAALAEQGWQSLVVWECETRDPEKLTDQLLSFLGAPRLMKCLPETAARQDLGTSRGS
jgi:DNA mismatch endonuclease (patch repair protein)